MARPESNAKFGTYPLDMWRAEQLVKLFKPAQIQGRLLEPGCNDGEAGNFIAQKLNLSWHGIELKEDAARAAQTTYGLNKCIYGDALKDVEMSNQAFAVIYENSPYQEDVSEKETGRVEYKWIQHFYKYLQPGGIYIKVMYRQHLTKKMCEFLFNKFTLVLPMYWGEKHLEDYTQVAVVCVKPQNQKEFMPQMVEKYAEILGVIAHVRDPKIWETYEDEDVGKISVWREMNKGFIHYPEYMSGQVRKRFKSKEGEIEERIVPDTRLQVPNPVHVRRFIFTSKEIDPMVMKMIHQKYGGSNSVDFRRAFDLQPESFEISPIRAQRNQLVVMIAAGMLNGVVVKRNGINAIVRGNVTKVTKTVKEEVEEDDEGNERKIETEHTVPTPEIFIIDERGNVENITEDTKILDFIKENSDLLMEYMEEHFPNLYDMHIPEMIGDVFDDFPVNGRSAYIPTQEYVITGGAEYLLQKNSLIVAAEPSFGKSQPLDSKVLTPTGWKRMGDIKVGDKVINSNGGSSNVTGVFPQGMMETFKVTLSDGGSTECCDEHLWLTGTRNIVNRNQPYVVKPLKELRKKLKFADGDNIYRLPIVKPIEFDGVPLPIDPYFLGLMLGDGHMPKAKGNLQFASADSQIIEYIKSILPDSAEIKHSGKYDYRIVGRTKDTKSPLKGAFESLGLLGKTAEDKFVPDIYKYSSAANRLAILQGLMDTDGYGNITPQFTSISERLAQDVREIAWSLGGWASISSKIPTYTYKDEHRFGQRAYTVCIHLPMSMPVFRLTRKIASHGKRTMLRDKVVRKIESVVSVGMKETQCIAVDSHDQLYVTDDYILTHNTNTAIATAIILRKFHNFQQQLLIKENLDEFGESAAAD